MDYLGLSGEEAYDDYDMSMEYERPQRAGRTAPDQGRRSNFDPEYSSETQRPAARPMRVDDTGAARRPDDSGLQVRPVGTARTSPTQSGQFLLPEKLSRFALVTSIKHKRSLTTLKMVFL